MIESLYDDVHTSFWMNHKFINYTFEKTQTGFLYCLLRSKRATLIRNGKLKDNNSWFFYPDEWLRNDLRKPNSLNHIKGLLKEIKDAGLIEFKNDVHKPYTRRYWINDEKFKELANDYALDVNTVRSQYFKSRIKNEGITEQQIIESSADEPLGAEYNFINRRGENN